VVRCATGYRNALTKRAPRSTRCGNGSSDASPLVTVVSVDPSMLAAQRDGARTVRTTGLPSAHTVEPSRSSAAAPRTTNATTKGAADWFAISTTATSPTSATGTA